MVILNWMDIFDELNLHCSFIFSMQLIADLLRLQEPESYEMQTILQNLNSWLQTDDVISFCSILFNGMYY
jgi:hypothetical protein